MGKSIRSITILSLLVQNSIVLLVDSKKKKLWTQKISSYLLSSVIEDSHELLHY